MKIISRKIVEFQTTRWMVLDESILLREETLSIPVNI